MQGGDRKDHNGEKYGNGCIRDVTKDILSEGSETLLEFNSFEVCDLSHVKRRKLHLLHQKML